MPDQPNILIIWGDDIGITNLSCYSDGIMGYRTPNIDRVAAEGVRFTDYYGEQSCTAGRAAFITGQNPYRTGLTKVGMPGAPIGLQAGDPTIATALKSQGYTTGQFGKNHFGDRDGFLPTMHGFDEFFGNLYHLNAEEEPELDDYPTEQDFPDFRKNFGPRGVIHSWANGDGTQRIEDTGPLTKERMKTIDDEVVPEALRFMTDAKRNDTPFFVWLNTTHMHFRTHIKDGSRGKAGRWQSAYHDTMVDHDELVGRVLDFLDEQGLAEDTIVMYSTDNGPHMNTWPDAGMTPFRNEKNSNWEGAYRVPALVRWPGRIPAGQVLNGIASHNDWFVTLLAAAGDTDIAARLQAGADLNGTTYKVHLDGHNQLDYITGAADESPRQHFFYVSDDGDLTALRYDNWKFVFMEQRDRNPPSLGRAVHRVAGAQDLQPPHRSVRTGRHHVEHLLRLVARSRVGARARAGLRRACCKRLPLSPLARNRRASTSKMCWRSSKPASPAPDGRKVVRLPGGTFTMGSDAHYPEEAPGHRVHVDAFSIDAVAVTNDDFAKFIASTGYLTVAERPLDATDFPGAPPENLVPGSLVFTPTPGPVDLRHISQWWAWTPGARWTQPEGPGSGVDDRLDHPVVHVAHEDAVAYATWAGKALPTEAEWEYAARGDLEGAAFTWGDDPRPGGRIMANTWDGPDFPWRSTGESGWSRTAPVGSFPPNGFELFDMAGNVWEWTDDWWTSHHPETVGPDAGAKACCVPSNPRGGEVDQSYDPAQPQFHIARKVIKGGSYLCADTYCMRYRPAARRPQMIDTGMSHLGFRCVERDRLP